MQQPGVFQQVEENTLKGKTIELTLLQLRAINLIDKISTRVDLRIAIVKPINILHQRQRLASETFSKQKRSGVRTMRRYSSRCRRMLPERIGWDAVEDHTGGAGHEEWQQVAQNVRRDCDDTIGRQ